MFRKVLVANRGEIAVRVLRALRERRIASVAVYSDADRKSLAVQLADEAAYLGPSPSSESYLRIDKLLAAARAHGADAIHPGYGFLSENADFAAACAGAGVTFIGPSEASIRALGSKTSARQLALSVGAPVVPGTDAAITDLSEAKRIASQIGYPVMIKAAAGGGGKGMRMVESESSLEAALRDAASEAERSFKSAEVYLEKALIHPRHIEIQLLGDNHGNLIHLGERECSLQRRHQKVIEESPSPLSALDPTLRHRMGEAALKIARAAGYSNAGTAEFLVDADRNFYFLEMNTRLQVEHPVTELVTSLDLVHLQLDLAAGAVLPLKQDDIRWTGHAIECRLYAEDPANNFFPSPGVIERLELPSGPGVRLDSGVYEGWNVPLDYDPLLAKLAVWAPDRLTAIARLERALSETVILGIRNNIHFFRQLLADPAVIAGDLHTTFLNTFRYQDPKPPSGDALAAALAAYRPNTASLPRSRRSAWRNS